ncbi:MAG: hypothetical protein II942_04235 [Alphaproteobacteria bacterium]|nr:hypothetical protein [Alphaproteobacteria bacterium]
MADDVKNIDSTIDNICVKFRTLDGQEFNEKIAVFLTHNNSTLTSEDQKKKDAIAKLYMLYKDGQLSYTFSSIAPTLDLITKITKEDRKKGKEGSYDPTNNTIIVENAGSTALTAALIAHELEHAQQMGGDMHKIFTGEIKTSAREKLQLKFLTEAQAYALGSYIYFKVSSGDTHFMGTGDFYQKHKKSFEPIEKILKDNPDAHWKDVERKLINAWLNILYEGKAMHYRDHYLKGNSIDPTDKSLTHIPGSFHLSQSASPEQLLSKLARAPLTPIKKEKEGMRKLLLGLKHIGEENTFLNPSSSFYFDKKSR